MERPLYTKPVRIGNNVWIAENSIFNRDVSDDCIVAGILSKVIKKWNTELKM